jgi:hypothetical protein
VHGKISGGKERSELARLQVFRDKLSKVVYWIAGIDDRGELFKLRDLSKNVKWRRDRDLRDARGELFR